MTTALGFLEVVTDGAPLAASPVEPLLKAAGARFEARDGWRVAVRVGDAAAERRALAEGVAIADRSAMAKTEVLARAGAAAADDGIDLTAGYAAFELRGPKTRSLLERLTAIDVRPDSLSLSAARAGVVARVPALLERTGDDVYLLVVGADVAPDVLEMTLDTGAVLIGEEARAGA